MSVRVDLREKDNVETMLKKLRRLCTRAGIARGRKARTFYEKPSERRRRIARERLRTIRKAERERAGG